MKSDRKWLTSNVLYWSLFDFANSSFAIIVAALLYAVYFKSTVAANAPAADLWWSIAINISMITVAVLSPVLGAASDRFNNKKQFLIIFTVISACATALLFFIREGMVIQGLALFIIANIGFQTGLTFYDAFIKEITLPEFFNKVSSLGYAVGYLGSLFSLILIFVFRDDPVYAFPACSVIFILFSLPFFIKVKERKNNITENKNVFRAGYDRIKNTVTHIRQFRNIRNFLFSYFLYIDGVNTIIFFSAIFAQTTLGFTISEQIIFFAIVQVTALLGSILLGYAADKTSTKSALMFTIICWAVITVIIYFVTSKLMFMIVGGFAGIFLGSTQALSRSLMGKLVPDEKKTEFFGFYSLFEKTSTILGPLAFGLISYITGSQRFGVLSLALFFISGFLLLRNVKQTVTTNA